VPVAQSARRDGAVEALLFDTRAKLGGYYIEVLAAQIPAEAGHGAADEVWHLRENGAARPPLLRLAASSTSASSFRPDGRGRGYSELFGITAFSFRNWHPAPNR